VHKVFVVVFLASFRFVFFNFSNERAKQHLKIGSFIVARQPWVVVLKTVFSLSSIDRGIYTCQPACCIYTAKNQHSNIQFPVGGLRVPISLMQLI
jgi:hypothetical protein